MRDASAARSHSGREWARSVAFCAYAVAAVWLIRGGCHHLLHGWPARLATMVGLILAFAPWIGWLKPQLVAAINVLSRWLLVVAYFTILAPFALLARLLGDPLRRRRSESGSQWIARRPSVDTLETARQEF